MAKEILKNDINDVLEMIRDMYHIIDSYEGKIPQIEIDIIMSNIRRLYDDFVELNKLNQKYKAEAEQEEIVMPVKIIETPAQPAVIEASAGEEPAAEILPTKEEAPEVTIPVKEIPVKKTEEPPVKIVKEEIKVKETPKSQPKKPLIADLFAGTENTPLADKFKDEKKSLHEKIASEKKEKTFADTIQTSIADLRTGIGVNDRFLMINELFRGSMQEYAAAIEDINSQASQDAALQKILDLKDQYQWNDDSAGLNRLLSFVGRRFR